MEDYSQKYKGEHVELALFGGEYQDGVLTAYCLLEDVPHVELNGHILVPLQNVASLHCTSRCDAPEGDWPPHGLRDAGSSSGLLAGDRRRCTSARRQIGRARVDRRDRRRRAGREQTPRRRRHADDVHQDRADHAAVGDAHDGLAWRRRARSATSRAAASARSAISG